MRNSLVLLALLTGVGCSTALPFEFRDGGTNPDGNQPVDLAHPDLAGACASLTQAQCDARSDCSEFTCPNCQGGQYFINCQDKNNPPPGICTASCPAPCSSYTDQKSCDAAASLGCTAAVCCGTFTSCLGPNEGQPPCPAQCPSACSTLNEAHCNADTTCHATYASCSGTTSCSPKFSACSDGAASCNSSGVMCSSLPPSCPNSYVPAVSNGCWEGDCIKQSACCSPGCGDKQTCEICWTGYQCLPDGAVC